jgi:type VI secretion system protein ImpH
MAAESGRKSTALIEKLFREGHRFDFFQAVRILERHFQELARADARFERQPVGHDYDPKQEVVRFKALPAHSFPAASIAQVRRPGTPAGPITAAPSPESREPDPADPPVDMVISFMGMTGPSGVLPQHFTTLLLTRVRDKDFALRDFFDLFNHRVVSLFCRAWEKYRFPLAYERAQRAGQDEDLFTGCLYSLVGMGGTKMRKRQVVSDETYLYYAGHFSHFPRSAVSLECLLQDYFELATRVEQFQGQWLYLHVEDCSRTPSADLPEGVNCQLGVNLIVGSRVWDVQSKLRIKLGPLDYAEFRRFMPTGDALRPICQLTRSYVGPEFDFDVHPILKGPEVPWCRLGADPAGGAHLGWNTWVRSAPFQQDVTDAVFVLEDE